MQGDAAAGDGKEVLEELELRTKLLADMEDKYNDLGETLSCGNCTNRAALLSCFCMQANTHKGMWAICWVACIAWLCCVSFIQGSIACRRNAGLCGMA